MPSAVPSWRCATRRGTLDEVVELDAEITYPPGNGSEQRKQVLGVEAVAGLHWIQPEYGGAKLLLDRLR